MIRRSVWLRYKILHVFALHGHRPRSKAPQSTPQRKVNLILNGYELDINDFPHIFLYGHPNISNVDNKTVLTATVDYLKNTERFEP